MINGISGSGRTDIVSIGAGETQDDDIVLKKTDGDAVLPRIAEETEITEETREAIREM